MNSSQLEQLISGYLDGELSPNRKQEVERLLQSDPAAKRLYDEFMAIRNEFRLIQRRNLPHDFQKNLFERIDKETVSVAGKLVEKTTSVDFTLPPASSARQRQHTKNRTKNAWSPQLKTVRFLAPVAIVFLIAVAVFVSGIVNQGQQTASVPPANIEQPNFEPQGMRVDVIPPPLPGVNSIPPNESLQSLAIIDGKPVLEVPCRLSVSAQDSQFVPTLLADSGYPYVIREVGTQNITVYEFELPLDQLLPFLSIMYSNEEFKNYKLPAGVVDLLHRPTKPADDQEASHSVASIIVRLNVAKEE